MRFIHFVVLTLLPLAAFASILGSVRGIVHDPQHRPVENTMVMLHSKTSDWSASVTTDATGQFILNGVALGEYTVTLVARAALFVTRRDKQRTGQRLGIARSRPHRFRHSHHPGQPPRCRTYSRRRPHPQPRHDHRLRSRRLLHPRPTPHPRRPPSQLAH